MSDLKSGGETYLGKIYTQDYNFIKIFFIGCLRQIDKIREKNGYWLFNNLGKRFFQPKEPNFKYYMLNKWFCNSN